MRLHDFLVYRARQQPDAEFAVHRRCRITYGEALAEVDRLASAFASAGLAVGDRFAFLSANTIEHLLVYFAASRAGVVAVPLNFRLTPAQWRFIVDDARARLFLVAAEYLDAVDAIGTDLASVGRYVAIGGPATPGWEDYRSWLAAPPDRPPERAVTRESDVYQMYTSGTTGRPKGAIITHGALTAHLVQVAIALEARPGRRTLVVTPLSHAHAAIQALA